MNSPKLLTRIPRPKLILFPAVPGERGQKGVVGEVGRRGRRGTKGNIGETGRRGRRGLQGEIGLHGEAGPQGDVGKAGAKGLQGRVGKAGAKGLVGPKGDTGPAPRHKWKGSKLSFENPDGSFGPAVNLKGDTGGRGMSRGVNQSFETIELVGTMLEFKKAGALGADVSVDLASISTGDEVLAQRVDDESGGTVLYIGEAAPGSIDSATVWRIKRITFTGQDSVTEWAGGTAAFDKIWDDHLTETYS